MKKITVYCLELDESQSIHFDIDGLCDGIKAELEDQDFESLKDSHYEIYVMQMTEKEIKELPEFDGF